MCSLFYIQSAVCHERLCIYLAYPCIRQFKGHLWVRNQCATNKMWRQVNITIINIIKNNRMKIKHPDRSIFENQGKGVWFVLAFCFVLFCFVLFCFENKGDANQSKKELIYKLWPVATRHILSTHCNQLIALSPLHTLYQTHAHTPTGPTPLTLRTKWSTRPSTQKFVHTYNQTSKACEYVLYIKTLL